MRVSYVQKLDVIGSIAIIRPLAGSNKVEPLSRAHQYDTVLLKADLNKSKDEYKDFNIVDKLIPFLENGYLVSGAKLWWDYRTEGGSKGVNRKETVFLNMGSYHESNKGTFEIELTGTDFKKDKKSKLLDWVCQYQ